ncbi:MAG: glycoside hydrolase family 3 C-terminal domain-containing protein [Gemmatimonadaceae bacterium]
MALSTITATGLTAQTPARTPNVLDLRRSFEARADDLVAQMSLAEKAAQMQDQATGIPRLGVPAYGWWNEALHGVARAGLATSFPQAIGMAATWNDSLIYREATIISDEARAKYNDDIPHDRHDRYGGLTFWSPNVNIFRDPRWGRGQETYGEDPFLTGRIATQFIRGMQGDNPKYLKTVSTVKHFAVHSGPEPARHTFNAVVSPRDLHETYLAQFKTGIEQGGAYSVMCSYNAVYGQPACANGTLLDSILRRRWGFTGYVVSDCDAVDDIFTTHKFATSAAAASAQAVIAGTDLDCGGTYASLPAAVDSGFITEARIDTSVDRLFLARFKLGMFDPPDSVPWSNIPLSDVDSPAHRALALQVARESMVLLKNQGNLLPLRKDLGTIAVIGPNADQTEVLLGNYHGTPADPITPLRGIREAVGESTRVLYALGSDLATGFPVPQIAPARMFATPGGEPGLRVEYFNDITLTGAPLFSGTDSTVDANWGLGAPRADMNPDDFGVRWTGTVRVPESGSYRLGLRGTVKFDLWLDDSLVISSSGPGAGAGRGGSRGEFPVPFSIQSPPLQLEAGKTYKLRIDASESHGDAQLQLTWVPPNSVLESQAVRDARQADAVVLVLGLTSRMEGEEMPLHIDGFDGGDRTKLALPAPQEALMERIVALGKPTVLVLLNGSALSINWANAHVPAILEAWYPGQAGGTAVAETLFGDNDPGGRLPITFYHSVNDLPPFSDYSMAGRTYRFFPGTPLYPFGYGLSYTTFAYSSLRTSADSVDASDTVIVSVDVTNTGSRAGDEVVQLYAHHLGTSVPRPNEDLRGFERVRLQPGQTRTVRMAMPVSSLAYWDDDRHHWFVESEPVQLRVGASSADIRLTTTVHVSGGS